VLGKAARVVLRPKEALAAALAPAEKGSALPAGAEFVLRLAPR
jgi:hypothetical protein